jgi:hypothetical protein
MESKDRGIVLRKGLLALSILSSAVVAGCAASGEGISLATPGIETADGLQVSQTVMEEDGFMLTVEEVPYPVVDTGQGICYDDAQQIGCPQAGAAFHGQDAQYAGLQPQYVDNGDGTVTDLNTGLMWQQDPGEKMNYEQAVAGVATFNLAGYDDWRLPTIKELYSLMLFSGTDLGPCPSGSCEAVPFIDSTIFHFGYGDESAGQRAIDSQWTTSTVYESTVMGGAQCFFGVNFADGRIKCYPMRPGGNGGYYTIYVRGDASYGQNSFVDNGSGTITDQATGLTWMQADSGSGMNWGEALAYCEGLTYAGVDDWRLPDAKELQSIVDYSRSPDTTNSAAIDPLFSATPITNEAGQPDYPAYWSSTTHARMDGSGQTGAYVAFGRAMGYMNNTWTDVHGAGAQRSDLKSGDPASWPQGRGPQGDAIRIYNYVRCVRGGSASPDPDGDPSATRSGVAIDVAPGGTGVGQGAGGQPGGIPPQGSDGLLSGEPPVEGEFPGGLPPDGIQPGPGGPPGQGQGLPPGGLPPRNGQGPPPGGPPPGV